MERGCRVSLEKPFRQAVAERLSGQESGIRDTIAKVDGDKVITLFQRLNEVAQSHDSFNFGS